MKLVRKQYKGRNNLQVKDCMFSSLSTDLLARRYVGIINVSVCDTHEGTCSSSGKVMFMLGQIYEVFLGIVENEEVSP